MSPPKISFKISFKIRFLDLIYPLCRNLLFLFPPEISHKITLSFLKYWPAKKIQKIPDQPITLWGLHFKNPIGLAAGLDKNGEYLDALAKLDFGFIEIGTVTPKPQTGNPKPRLFRLKKSQALINRMGFNNQGIDALISNIQHSDYRKNSGILGINIGKNGDTPLEHALEDYLICLEKAYPYAGYITVNISSPNTHQLRELQHGEYFEALLKGLKKSQADLAVKYQKYVPLCIKISPDLSLSEIQAIATLSLKYKIDGVIATNTTLSREGVDPKIEKNALEKGGLSGRPLSLQSTKILKALSEILKDKIPLIASGGILTPEDAESKFLAGAKLIQIYSGLIYKGPGLVQKIAFKIREFSST